MITLKNNTKNDWCPLRLTSKKLKSLTSSIYRIYPYPKHFWFLESYEAWFGIFKILLSWAWNDDESRKDIWRKEQRLWIKLLTMTLAGLLPVRKIKAGITMPCPVRECHVVFVRSESSHLNSSNQKQYEKKVSKYVSVSKVFSLSHWISHRASTNVVSVVHVDTNLTMLVMWELDLTENYVVFNRSSSSPNIFLPNLTLKGTVKLQTEAWAIVAVDIMLKIAPQIL